MNRAKERIGRLPYIVLISFIATLLLGRFTSPDTWGEIWKFWCYFAVFSFGYVVGKIVSTHE